MQYNIVLIEDEKNMNRGISLKLQKEGYQVLSASSAKEGQQLFDNNAVDLVICDIGLPDGSGLDLCTTIRKKSDVLFLFLTALDTEVDIITGYEVGADDYVTKPFSMTVLISKVNALLKRSLRVEKNVIHSGRITLLLDEKRVLLDGEIMASTPTDWKLLQILMQNPRHILSRKQLLNQLWDLDSVFIDENSIAVNIRRLREKIEPDPSNPVYIKNIRGMGYVWEMECWTE